MKQVNDKRESSFRGQKWCVLVFFVEHSCHPLGIPLFSHYYFIYRYSTTENTLLLISRTFSKLCSIPVHSKCLSLSLFLSLSHSIYLSIYLSLSLCLSVSLHISYSPALPLSASASPSPLSLSLSFSHSLSLPLLLSLSLPLTLP